jgi:hypothetical protein
MKSQSAATGTGKYIIIGKKGHKKLSEAVKKEL